MHAAEFRPCTVSEGKSETGLTVYGCMQICETRPSETCLTCMHVYAAQGGLMIATNSPCNSSGSAKYKHRSGKYLSLCGVVGQVFRQGLDDGMFRVDLQRSAAAHVLCRSIVRQHLQCQQAMPSGSCCILPPQEQSTGQEAANTCFQMMMQAARPLPRLCAMTTLFMGKAMHTGAVSAPHP